MNKENTKSKEYRFYFQNFHKLSISSLLLIDPIMILVITYHLRMTHVYINIIIIIITIINN